MMDDNNNNRWYYNNTISEVIRTMLVDYNSTIRDIDDPYLPLSVVNLLRQQRHRFCFLNPCLPIRRGQRQRMDLYQWLFHNCNTWYINNNR